MSRLTPRQREQLRDLKDDPAKREGLDREKFVVRRADGRSRKGEKHAGCQYFVLDLNHDPMALPALRAYAKAALRHGYRNLSLELRGRIFQLENAMVRMPR